MTGSSTPTPRALAPVVAVTDRLRTSTRLAVLAAVLLVPGLVATWSYASVITSQVRFTQAERAGVVVLEPALTLLAEVTARRPVDLGPLKAAVAAHPELDAGEQLAAVERLVGPAEDATAAAARQQLGAALVALITQVGNTSNLILDPDLDSFYVMDSLVVQVPKVLDAANQAGLAPSGGLERQVATQAVVAGTLTSAAQAVSGDVTTATGNTSRTDLAAGLAPLGDLVTAATTLSQTLTSSLDRPAAADPTPVGAAALAAVEKASAELDALLAAREAGLASSRSTTLAITVTGLLVAAWFAAGVWWRTRVDVGAALTAVTAIADGDLQAHPLPDGRDELGDIGRALDAARRTLGEAAEQLAHAQAEREEQLQASFDQQRRAQSEVRERAQAIVDETARVVAEELRGMTTHVVGARTAASTIDERVKAADEVTRGVVRQAQEAEQVVTDLGRSLREVAGMAKLIAGVADQTKLLALNATIEAARAGESGRGFSVVAGEVKSLAITTAESTDRITSTIASLERDASAMAAVINEMTQRISGLDETTAVLGHVVDQQYELVEQLGSTLDEAVDRVVGMSTQTSKLERRSHERVPYDLAAELDVAGQTILARTVDLGVGGLRCRLTGPLHLAAGQAVAVRLVVDGRPCLLQCEVARVDELATSREVALQFVGPADADRQAVLGLLERRHATI